MRRIGFWVAVMLLAGLAPAAGVTQAPGAGELEITAQLSSAEHETIEGYFTLGDSLAVMAKPGSDLHRFLVRQRGRRLKVTFTPETRDGPSRLIRDE